MGNNKSIPSNHQQHQIRASPVLVILRVFRQGVRMGQVCALPKEHCGKCRFPHFPSSEWWQSAGGLQLPPPGGQSVTQPQPRLLAHHKQAYFHLDFLEALISSLFSSHFSSQSFQGGVKWWDITYTASAHQPQLN